MSKPTRFFLVACCVLVLPNLPGSQVYAETAKDGIVYPPATAKQTETDEYTRYELLEPETASFKISYEVTATTAGAKFFYNPIRKGSVARDESVYDAMSGKPLHFEIVSGTEARKDALMPSADLAGDYIKVTLARPVPANGQGSYTQHASGGYDFSCYGPNGFVQYQILVPFGHEPALREVIERLASSGAASFVTVLKRFGAANRAPLSFPEPGWTLALDIPARSRDLGELLHGLDRLVLDAGGRHYLAKDSHTTPESIRRGYPRLAEWQRVRDSLDPSGRWCSDQARRLELVTATDTRRRS